MNKSRKIYTVSSKPLNESKTVKPKMNTRSLHKSLKWLIFVAQCFGQMPVMGIAAQNFRSIRFSWKSWRTIYCILNCVGSGFLAGFYIYRIIQNRSNIFEYSSLAFHFNTFVVTIFFLKLAAEWSKLMYRWAAMEFSMRTYGWPPHLHTRITFLSITVLTLAAVETVMTKLSKVSGAARCKREDDNLFEYYSKAYLYPEIFATINYAMWKAILLQIENLLVTFAWTFNDLFIMVMCTAIALRFKQIATRLKVLKSNGKVGDIAIWRETREDYNRLCELTRNVDEALSYITLTSFSSNLFFILMQLFHSLRKMKDTLEKVYFFLSFAFLILRTIWVSLYGAWIYDESKEPLTILHSVSSDVYNAEIRRFIEQIKFDTVALTGKHFFYVTRGLILSMAGAIVTYELVLIQFNENLLKESAEHAKNYTAKC